MSRASELQNLAYRMELQYRPEDEWGLMALLRDFRLFKRGFSKKIRHIIHHADSFRSLSLNVFDYSYKVKKGKRVERRRQTVFFLQSKYLSLPEMRMQPENFFHRIGEWLGMQDIDFEEFPEFSDSYLLKGEDEEYIRHTMNEKVLRFFTVEKMWSLEGVGYFMVLYKKNEVVPVREIEKFIDKGLYLHDMFTQSTPH